MNKRKFRLDIVIAAHKRSIRHRNEILQSDICGCFNCLNIFNPSDIEHWIDKNENGIGQTAMCPKCSVDTVLGSKSGYTINSDFLTAMKRYWCS